MMCLLHGSENIIENPIFGKGNPENDYGLAFYTTREIIPACEWAVEKDLDGYVNKYLFDESKFKILNLDLFTPVHWAATIFRHRYASREWGIYSENVQYLIDNFSFDVRQYDAVIGNRADDTYFAIADAFASGVLSVRDLSVAIKFGNWGKQTAIVSPEAFRALRFVGADHVSAAEWYGRRKQRELNAGRLFNAMLQEKQQLSREQRAMEIKIGDIAGEKMTENSPDLAIFKNSGQAEDPLSQPYNPSKTMLYAEKTKSTDKTPSGEPPKNANA